jgi:hypothetical protein
LLILKEVTGKIFGVVIKNAISSFKVLDKILWGPVKRKERLENY